MTAPIDNKTFADLRAQAALIGYKLTRSDPADGPQVFFIERFGLVQPVMPGDLAERINAMAGG